MNEERCQKCEHPDCIGYYLLHPKEMKDIPTLKEKQLKENPNAEFELMVSPSSGEIFTTFHELHVRVKN